MRIFLTGASGLVGSAFARAACRRGHHVVGVVGKFAERLDGVAEQITADLADPVVVTRHVLHVFPDAIVNCAAVSEPAACEADPVRSQALNVMLPERLAQLAQHLVARLVHISSEQVFDGQRTAPYANGDAVSPINLYGRQKVTGEHAAITAAPRNTAIIRAPLLMGNSPGGKRSLHERLFADWSAGRIPHLFTDEFRQPCTAENLAEVLLELVERPDTSGVFHWAGTELLSRYELGCRVRAHFKLAESAAPIKAVDRSSRPEFAAHRQPCLALDLAPLTTRLKTHPQTVAGQLSQLLVPSPCRQWYCLQG